MLVHQHWLGTSNPNHNHGLCPDCGGVFARSGEAVGMEEQCDPPEPCCGCGELMTVGHRWTGRPNSLAHCGKAMRREGRGEDHAVVFG